MLSQAVESRHHIHLKMDIDSIYFSSQSVGMKQSTEAFYRV